MKVNIGHKIRKAREIKGFTQEFMAGNLKMSQRAYSKIENNDIKLDWGRIEDISKILKIEPAFLVSFDDSFVFNNHFSSELKKSYETLIDHLEKEVLFLRRLLEQS